MPSPLGRVQPFLPVHQLRDLGSKSLLGLPLLWLVAVQLHEVPNLSKWQKSEKLQIPVGRQKGLLNTRAHTALEVLSGP